MVDEKPSLKELQVQISRERAKISKAQQRRRLTSELQELRLGQKVGVRLARRFGRGLKETTKKVGGALSRQAQRIAAAQQQERLAQARIRTKTKIRRPKKKTRRTTSTNGFDMGSIISPLDF